jgi:hypothetical protein
LDLLTDELAEDPRSCGDIVEIREHDELWAWETPTIGDLPIIYAVYAIIDEDRRVDLLSVTTLRYRE